MLVDEEAYRLPYDRFPMKCLLCSNAQTSEFLDLGKQPLANKYPTKEEFASELFYPMKLFFCPRCKNVQLGHLVSREKMFVDYYYLSSVNAGLVRHFEALAKTLAQARFVVDIGSNDGILLKPLKEHGVQAVGVDPSINVSKIANDQGLTTLTSFFNAETVARIKKDWGEPDVIVASSIFTHLEDPPQFIEDVKDLLTDDGKFIIEVEYIGTILKNIQFERFYFDRIFYYSLTSLRDLCAAHQMSVADVEEIEPHGGSLRVIIYKDGYRPAPSERISNFLKEEGQALTPATLGEFKQAADTQIAAFRAKLEEYKRNGLKVAGYGAPARVATICNYGDIGPSLIEFIVDDSPLKQNRYSPGTHIPIQPKAYLDEQGADVLVVFAYEYFEDIKKKTGGRYRYLVPIPPREIV
jgi:SAM-dependent methyltransferase